MAALHVHDSMTGRKVGFAPSASPVTMYVCGPTVYGEAHVGNARPVVVFDVLYRLLRHDYGNVSYARNVTDIDDKIIAAAKEAGEDFSTLAMRHETSFKDHARSLGCLEPTYQPRATEHIAGMIELAAELVAKGHAYEEQGHLLFSVSSFGAYGMLSNRDRDSMVAGARVEVAPYKRDPVDFVLWKPSASDQPGWDSPWGRGRPGWHLECSTMIRTCLGATIDIHGGGNDLAFPHHENEIAQSRCASGTNTLARYWMHNGHVTTDGRKMAKSVGNYFLLCDALGKVPGEAVRYALMQAHYRSPLDWGTGKLQAAEASLTSLYRSLDEGCGDEVGDADLPAEFLDALRDDLDTPGAIALLHRYSAGANRAVGGDAERMKRMLYASGSFLGLFSIAPAQWARRASEGTDAEMVETLIDERANARKAKDYVRADEIRKMIEAEGVVIEDTASGTKWRSK